MGKDSARYKPGQFAQLPMSLLTNQRFHKLRSSRQVVLIALIMHRNKKHNAAWPTQETLASELGLGKRWVQEAICDLRDEGLIETKRRFVNGATRLVYTFPVMDDQSALECASPKRTLDRDQSALTEDQSALECATKAQGSAHITEEEHTKLEHTNNNTEKEVVVVDSQSVVLLKKAGLPKQAAEQYGKRWDAEYLEQLIKHCNNTAKTNPQGLLIKALKSQEQWQLPAKKLSFMEKVASLPPQKKRELDEKTKEGIWNQCHRVWPLADKDQLAVLQSVFGDAEGLAIACPLPFLELLGSADQVLDKLVLHCTQEQARKVVA